jgi:carbamoyl-phosphate synthase large subunit
MRKAMRSLDRPGPFRPGGWPADLEEQLAEPSGDRLAAILLALQDRWDCEDVARLSGIHPWFVDRLAALATSIDTNGSGKHVFKMVDTCSAEFEARTPYFYSSSVPDGENEASPLPGPKAIILGSGPIRIGQGIEFDYATVHACHALSQSGVRSIIVNNNPETVSTDYSTSDRLYFEPLDLEAVAAVVENEADGLLGVIPQFGGQTAINLVQPLYERGIPILGTTPEAIDVAEDRSKTSALLADCGIPAPNWRAVDRWDELPMAVEAVGFPALIRPSYVLSGRGMIIVRTAADLERYIASHLTSPLSKPLLVDHFLEGAVELDVDAVSDGRDAVMVVMEQLEECGVHSGDSAEVYPVQTITPDIVNTVEMYTRRLAQALGIVGLMNVQYAVLGETVYVLEVNPRASRSVPFASKASGIPLADLAIRVILGQRLSQLNVASPGVDHVCIKEVVLPFRTFTGLVPILGPEMQSTGESMGRGRSFGEAYWKARLGADLKELPFGRPVYVSAPTEVVRSSSLAERLAAAGCSLLVAPDMKLQPHALECTANEVLVADLGMAIVLGRSPDEVGLLRRCVSAGVPYVSTAGGLRALLTALDEGVPCLQVEAQR